MDGKIILGDESGIISEYELKLPDVEITNIQANKFPKGVYLPFTEDIIQDVSLLGIKHNSIYTIPYSVTDDIIITLGVLSYFEEKFTFEVVNDSNKLVSFSDGTSVIVDIDGNGKVRQNGICEVQWDGSDFFLLGNLEF